MKWAADDMEIHKHFNIGFHENMYVHNFQPRLWISFWWKVVFVVIDDVVSVHNCNPAVKYNSKLILETRLVVEMIWSSPDITIYIVVVTKNSIGTKEGSGGFLQVDL